MTCLVARHARHADLSEPPLVDVCRWDQASTPEGDGPPVVDVGAEEGGVAEGRVVSIMRGEEESASSGDEKCLRGWGGRREARGR